MEIRSLYKSVLAAMELASEVIMEVYQNDEIFSHTKQDGSPVTLADLESSKILHRELAKTNLPILGEEAKKAAYDERKNWDYYWCIDPLDGTKEFLKRNGEFAINVALIHEHRAVFGAICSPITKEVILGGEDFGAFWSKLDGNYALNPIKRIENRNDVITLIISRTHFNGLTEKFSEIMQEKYGGFNYLGKGSALKFFDLANGNADIYARFGPTMEWDIAAGDAILRQLDGVIFDYETQKPLQYNKEDLYNPFFLALTKPLLADFPHEEN